MHWPSWPNERPAFVACRSAGRETRREPRPERLLVGIDLLDTWFRDHALTAQQQDTARTFVLVEEPERVVGFSSLTVGSVDRADAPRRLVRGLPRFPVPIVLLFRLAVDIPVQGHGIGRGLLYEALHRAALAGEQAAARLIAVNPADERARSFDERWGSRRIEGDALGRLFIRTRDALASFPGEYDLDS